MDTGLFRELIQLLHQLTTENTIEKLTEEQVKALMLFFVLWARRLKGENPTIQEIAAELVAAFSLGHEWVGRHWLLWTTDTPSRVRGKEMKANAPGLKVTNVNVNLGPRVIMAGDKKLGVADSFTIEVAEATMEELEKLKSANEIRLVKMLGEEGGRSD